MDSHELQILADTQKQIEDFPRQIAEHQQRLADTIRQESEHRKEVAKLQDFLDASAAARQEMGDLNPVLIAAQAAYVSTNRGNTVLAEHYMRARGWKWKGGAIWADFKGAGELVFQKAVEIQLKRDTAPVGNWTAKLLHAASDKATGIKTLPALLSA